MQNDMTKMTTTHLQSCPEINLSSLEIVVAQYREDLSWLYPKADLVTLYSKAGPEFPPPSCFARRIQLPNIGRESHSYLYHIVNNFNRLADVTVFTQGQIQDHVGPNIDLNQILDACKILTPTDPFMVYTKHNLKYFNSWSGISHVKKWKAEYDSGVMRRANSTPREFWKWVFGTDSPDVIAFSWGAIFAVRREAIQRRPKEFYERLLKLFESINHINPEEGHYMERIWLNIFVPGRSSVPVVPFSSEGLEGVSVSIGERKIDWRKEISVSSVAQNVAAGHIVLRI
jgi:hypothetical protein